MSRLRTWIMLVGLWLAAGGCSVATVSPGGDEPRDGEISAQVESKLASDRFGGLSGVIVATEAGVVTLMGAVERAEQKARAADLARQVEGVKRVKNDLEIRGTTTP